MLPRRRKFYIIIIAFLSTAYFCIFASYQSIAANKSSLMMTQKLSSKLCDNKNIGNELEPLNSQVLSRSEILFKTKSFQTLSLSAAPLPTIHPAAKNAKIPVMM